MIELLRRFLGRYRGRALAGMLCKVVEVVFDLITPMIVAHMIDAGVHGRDTALIMRSVLLLLALAAVGYCSTLVCQKMAALVSQGSGTDIRNALYAKVNSFSAPEVDRFGTPSLVTRITNDVNQVQVAVALGIRQLIRWPILAVGSVVASLMIDLRLGLIFLVCMPVIGIVFWVVMSKSVPYFQTMQAKLDRVSLITREALSGARVIRAFRREASEDERFAEAAHDQADTAIAVGKLSAILNPATILVMNLGVVAILWAGGFQVSVGDLQQGEVMAFVNYMTQALASIVYVANLVVVFTRGSASARRILEVLDVEPSITDGSAEPLALPAPGTADALALDHVSFSYGATGAGATGEGAPAGDAAGNAAQRRALDDVTLALPEGQTLGIIGGTGSGKSTLVNLAARLYDATQGTVSVLGRDVRDYPLAQLHQLVSVVPQDASLVSGTIRSNLQWRDSQATDEELWHALDVAQATDFVRAKADGLDTVVEAGGRNFSGGQRQRLTIARALVGHPRMVLLDDSASALDFATDAHLRAALRKLRQELTCVIVSQRVSAVMGADQILVLHHGHVAGLGTHEELLKNCDIYREICLSQLKREEVDR